MMEKATTPDHHSSSALSKSDRVATIRGRSGPVRGTGEGTEGKVIQVIKLWLKNGFGTQKSFSFLF